MLLSFGLLFLQTRLYSAELAKDGATSWKTVLPDEPTIVEKTAARELAEHLKLVTGADFQTTAAKAVKGLGEIVGIRGRGYAAADCGLALGSSYRANAVVR